MNRSGLFAIFKGRQRGWNDTEAAIENTITEGVPGAATRSEASALTTPQSRALENWIVITAIIVSAIVAGIHIRHASIWYDEAITLLVSSGHAVIDWPLGMQQFKPTANLLKILHDLYKNDVHPPLYFWTLALWRVVLGASLEVARSLSTVFILGTLALLYRYAIDIRLRWPSVPVVIYALSAAGLRYAYNARPYAMATFLMVLTLVLSNRKSKWAGFCGAACVGTHYFAGICVGPILAVECLLKWREDRRWSLWTAGSFAAGCAPLVVLVMKHVGARPHQYPGFGIFRKEVSALVTAAISGGMPSTSLWPAWHWALLLAALFAFVGSIWAIRKRMATVPLAYAGFLCTFLMIALVTHKSIMKMPNDYYLGVGAPLLVLLISYGVTAVPWASPLLVVALVAGTVTAKPMLPWVDYRAMMTEIRGECDHCAVVAGVGYFGAVPACVLYEAKGIDVYLLEKGDNPDDVVERIGERAIYLIPANDPATVPVEGEFVAMFPNEMRTGYYRVDATRHNPK